MNREQLPKKTLLSRCISNGRSCSHYIFILLWI